MRAGGTGARVPWIAWTARYAAAGLGLVAGVGLVLGLLMDPIGGRGVLLAGGIAWTVQVVAFGALLRYREGATSFLVAWSAGTLVRMGVIFLGALLVIRVPELPPAPTLLALAGFFFGLLLLEGFFFWRATAETARGGTAGREAGER